MFPRLIDSKYGLFGYFVPRNLGRFSVTLLQERIMTPISFAEQMASASGQAGRRNK